MIWRCMTRTLPLLLLASVGLSTAAPAATITVGTLDDPFGSGSGQCSLREAIHSALNDALLRPEHDGCVRGDGDDTIVFSVTGTIILNDDNEPLPDIQGSNGNLSIVGPGSADLVIDGSGEGLFTVRDIEFELSGVSLTGGVGGTFGGALWVTSTATATVEDVEVFGNTAQTGGGIANGGTLVLRDSVIRDNVASGGTLGGGGIYNSGTLALSDTEISGNTTNGSGGGVHTAGDITLANVIVANNVATGQGNLVEAAAGIYAGGDVSVSGSRIEGNEIIDNASPFVQRIAGGILGSAVTLVDTWVADNTATTGSNIGGTGSAIYAREAVTVSRSTISGNISTDAVTRVGGAVYLAGLGTSSTLVNSTVSGNRSREGAGVYLAGGGGSTLSVTHATVAGNAAIGNGIVAGIRSAGAVTVTLGHAILHGNDVDCLGAGSFVSSGYNIAGDDSCNLNAAGDRPSTDPMLGPLADNGGPTPTHALRVGSPAVDAGDGETCPDIDQRGMVRPQDGNGDGAAACDIGAFELNPPDLLLEDMGADPDPVTVGDEVVISVTARNAGSVDVGAVVVVIELPAELDFVTAAGCAGTGGGVVSCALGTLEATSNVSIGVTAVASRAAETATITAAISGNLDEANTDNNEAQVSVTIEPQTDNGGGGNGGGGGGGGALTLLDLLLLFLPPAILRKYRRA